MIKTDFLGAKMVKETLKKDKEKSWNPKDAYQKVSAEINEWPNWKKKAYNEIFAISSNAKRLSV